MGDDMDAIRRAIAEGMAHALLSNSAKDYDFDGLAHDAVKYADALLAELAKKVPRS